MYTHHPRSLVSEGLLTDLYTAHISTFLTSLRFYWCCGFLDPILSSKIPYALPLNSKDPCSLAKEWAYQHVCPRYMSADSHPWTLRSPGCYTLSACSANKTNTIETLNHVCRCIWLIVKPKLYSHPERISSLYKCTCCASRLDAGCAEHLRCVCALLKLKYLNCGGFYFSSIEWGLIRPWTCSR